MTMTRRSLAAFGTAVVLVATMATAASADHVPLVDVSLGFPHQATFNGGTDGWTAVTPPAPPTTSWARGAITSGPGVAASGTHGFATNPAGLYTASDCGAIVSPPIDLTGATSASISFMQWRHIEESTLTAFDAGLLFVSTDGGTTFTKVTPAGGYTSKPIGTTSRACLKAQPTGTLGLSGPTGTTPPPPVYTAVTTDLTAFANQTVRFAIAFASDSITQRAGWYVDDVTTTIDGVSTTQDFETSDGGFTVQSWGTLKTPLGWSHGTQSGTGGPGQSPNSDPPLWATNLSGNYGFNECSSIESPPISLEPAGNVGTADDDLPAITATLTWDQWFQSFSTAGGVVQVGKGGTYTNVKPTTGYPGNPTASLDACLQDDTQTSGAFTGTSGSTDGGPMTTFRADLTPWVGETITIRYLFASTNTATLDSGWYVDNVNVEMRARVGEPHPPTINPTPGWSQGGTSSSWAYGVATAGPTGATAWGTNLAGNYNPSECSYIDSPAVPGALLNGDPNLSFQHWYKIESVFSTLAWDGGVVLVSTDDGVTWTYLALPEYTRPAYSTALKSCLASHGVPGATPNVFSGSKQTWDTVSVNLSAYTSAPTVKVRFLFGSDSSVHYDGWFVRNVSIAGVPLLVPQV